MTPFRSSQREPLRAAQSKRPLEVTKMSSGFAPRRQADAGEIVGALEETKQCELDVFAPSS